MSCGPVSLAHSLTLVSSLSIASFAPGDSPVQGLGLDLSAYRPPYPMQERIGNREQLPQGRGAARRKLQTSPPTRSLTLSSQPRVNISEMTVPRPPTPPKPSSLGRSRKDHNQGRPSKVQETSAAAPTNNLLGLSGPGIDEQSVLERLRQLSMSDADYRRALGVGQVDITACGEASGRSRGDEKTYYGQSTSSNTSLSARDPGNPSHLRTPELRDLSAPSYQVAGSLIHTYKVSTIQGSGLRAQFKVGPGR